MSQFFEACEVRPARHSTGRRAALPACLEWWPLRSGQDKWDRLLQHGGGSARGYRCTLTHTAMNDLGTRPGSSLHAVIQPLKSTWIAKNFLLVRKNTLKMDLPARRRLGGAVKDTLLMEVLEEGAEDKVGWARLIISGHPWQQLPRSKKSKG